MDKIYILSHGILEQYVLGELDKKQQAEVENALKTDSELREKLQEIELSFEHLAFDNAVNVSDDVKQALFSKISEQKTKNLNNKNSNKFYFAIAASIALFMLIGSVYLFSELKSTKEQLQIVENENSALLNEMQSLNNSIEQTKKWYATINDPETEKYVMHGNDRMPEVKVISYVNDIKKEVMVNTELLTALDEQHDYQMWADVKGVMINMGLIKAGKDLLAVNYIEGAESLNITIEPAGGSDHPNVAQLVTNVYLK